MSRDTADKKECRKVKNKKKLKACIFNKHTVKEQTLFICPSIQRVECNKKLKTQFTEWFLLNWGKLLYAQSFLSSE